MQVHTEPKLKKADPFFLAGKFCVTDFPHVEESKFSLGDRILPRNSLAQIPAAYGPCFLLQLLSTQVERLGWYHSL